MVGPETHAAAILHAVGSDLVVERRPTPSPGPGEDLLRNHAIGLNPIDWKVQAMPNELAVLPLVLGTGMSSKTCKLQSLPGLDYPFGFRGPRPEI